MPTKVRLTNIKQIKYHKECIALALILRGGAFNKESQKEMQSFLDFLYLRLSIHFLSFDVIYLA